MQNFIIGFLCGLFLGAGAGLFTAALCFMARKPKKGRLKMRCGICNWWKDGVCHKYPPIVVAVTEENPYVDTPHLVAVTEWPATNENDYCGEFEKVD